MAAEVISSLPSSAVKKAKASAPPKWEENAPAASGTAIFFMGCDSLGSRKAGSPGASARPAAAGWG